MGSEMCIRDRSDEALTGSAALKEVDDILLQSSSIGGLARELDDVLNRCKTANITISKKKVNLTTSENNNQIPFTTSSLFGYFYSSESKSARHHYIYKQKPVLAEEEGEGSSRQGSLSICPAIAQN